jgi:putative endonuclease
MAKNMYFTYVLKSIKDGKRYIGFTKNIKVRLKFHNAGLNSSTKNRRPFELLCFKKFESKIEAMRYEKYLKSLKGGRQLDIEMNDMF